MINWSTEKNLYKKIEQKSLTANLAVGTYSDIEFGIVQNSIITYEVI